MFRRSKLFNFYQPTIFSLAKKVKFNNLKISNDEDTDVLHINKIEIDGFDLDFFKSILPQPLQIEDNSIKEKKFEIEVTEPKIEEEECQIENFSENLLFDDFGNDIVNSYPKYKTISWNQNTTLFLLLNNKSSCTVSEFLEALIAKKIKASNWPSNIKKFFSVKGEVIKKKEGTDEECKSRFELLKTEIRDHIADLDAFLATFKTNTLVSGFQIFHTLEVLLKNKEVDLEEIYKILKKNNVSQANYLSSISTKFMRYFVRYDQNKKRISLYQGKEFLDVLLKHKNLFRVKISTEKSILIEQKGRTLENNSVLVEDKVYINLPKIFVGNDIEIRRDLITLIIACLKKHGIEPVKSPSIIGSMNLNNMAPMQLPRDIFRSDNILYDPKNKSFDLLKKSRADEIIDNFLSYDLKETDLTKKSREFLQILSSFKDKDSYLKKEFLASCGKRGVRCNLHRDFPRVFGYFDSENFRPCKHRIIEAENLLKTKFK